MANKKAATALQKWKVYGMHSKLISLAARGGADPNENPTLFTAIEKAKKDSVPKDVIEKAIRRGAGLIRMRRQLRISRMREWVLVA